MMMMTFGAVAAVGLLWVLFGFSMVFGTSYGGFVGSFTEFAGMTDLLEPMTTVDGLPISLFAVFQALFAAITVALISGAVADRMKFGAWMGFATLWAVLVYFPVAHWVFAFDGVVTENSVGGWIANTLGAVDFAGGTAVHINAGAAATPTIAAYPFTYPLFPPAFHPPQAALITAFFREVTRFIQVAKYFIG